MHRSRGESADRLLRETYGNVDTSDISLTLKQWGGTRNENHRVARDASPSFSNRYVVLLSILWHTYGLMYNGVRGNLDGG